MTEYTVQINGIKVSARYSERAVNEIFVPLLEKLTAMQRAAGRRILVLLAAPPGAGKSTLVSFLEKLASAIRQVRSGETCGWPVYDRLLHNPVEDAITVDGDIVLLEGNYLLLDEEGWRDLSAYADYTVSVSAGETLLRKRLIERKILTGVAEDAAVRFVDFSDMPNVRLCLEKSRPADLRLQVGEDGDYRIISPLSGS